MSLVYVVFNLQVTLACGLYDTFVVFTVHMDCLLHNLTFFDFALYLACTLQNTDFAYFTLNVTHTL